MALHTPPSASELNAHLASLRVSYKKGSLDVKDVQPDPITQFGFWLKDAVMSGLYEPNAMCLSTCSR